MSNELKRSRILVVDDTRANLVAMRALLRNFDAEVECVQSAREALMMMLDNADYALLLLDVQMPEMDGYELAAILHEEESTRDIPIIFITAIDKSKTYELKGYSSGAIDFIFKPVDRVILQSKVKIFRTYSVSPD